MNRMNSITVITAGDASDDSVFQPQVVQEPGGAVVVGPLFHNDQLSDAIGRTGSFSRMHNLIIIIYPVISRMMAETVDSFLLPDLYVVRFTTFGQNPVFVVPDRD
jgi:hypothetical protein